MAPPHRLLLLAATASASLDALLFYTCVTPQVGNQCEEGFTLDQMGLTTAAFSQNLTTVAAGRAQGNVTTLYVRSRVACHPIDRRREGANI